jgi:hypothetical protein
MLKSGRPRNIGLTRFDTVYAVSDKVPHGGLRENTLSKTGSNPVNCVAGQDVDGEEPTRKPMPKADIFDRKAADEMMERVRRKIERELKVTPHRRGGAGRVRDTR